MERALPPPRFFRAVIFGSARVEAGDDAYEDARTLARALSKNGIDIVTGGGPGIMEAASRGAMEGRTNKRVWSWGVCIEQLNREEEPNAFLSRAYKHRNFFTRLHQFARLGGCGVFVVMPGGFGSDLEEATILQLLQVRHLKEALLIEIGQMWREKIAWRKKWMVPHFASSDDVTGNIISFDHAIEALPVILEAHHRFKGLRVAS